MTDPSGSPRDADDLPEPAEEADYASVVHVSKDDDVATICGRIDTAPSYAVVIHAPGGNRELAREIGMRRVMRHAQESGKTIAFATRSLALSSRARGFSIPVARRPEYVRWDAGGRIVMGLAGRTLVIPAIGRMVQISVIAVIAVLFIGLVLTMGPSATVIAYPAADPVETVLTVTTGPEIDEIDLENVALPASQVSSSRVITVAIPTTGSTTVAVDPATVTLEVSNPLGGEVDVPAGTVVLAEIDDETVEFTLDEELIIPAEDQNTITATAVEAGSPGNVDAGTLTQWESDVWSELSVTNPEPASGGGDETVAAVAEDDIVTLRDTANLLQEDRGVQETIIADRPGDAILADTATVDIDRGEPSADPGTPAEVVIMDVAISVSALAITEETWDEVAPELLLDDDEEREFILGSVQAVETGETEVDPETGNTVAEFAISAAVATEASSAEILEAVKGASPGDARSILETRYGIDDAEIDVSPGWAPRLPRFDFRIDVELRSRLEDDSAIQPTGNELNGSDSTAASP